MAQEWVGARWSDELSCLEVGSHPQESLRLEALKEVGLLDTATEEVRVFENIASHGRRK